MLGLKLIHVSKRGPWSAKTHAKSLLILLECVCVVVIVPIDGYKVVRHLQLHPLNSGSVCEYALHLNGDIIISKSHAYCLPTKVPMFLIIFPMALSRPHAILPDYIFLKLSSRPQAILPNEC